MNINPFTDTEKQRLIYRIQEEHIPYRKAFNQILAERKQNQVITPQHHNNQLLNTTKNY